MAAENAGLGCRTPACVHSSTGHLLPFERDSAGLFSTALAQSAF